MTAKYIQTHKEGNKKNRYQCGTMNYLSLFISFSRLQE